ncbi:nicotinate phosphoribosyltransferase family-domain-containing protein [Paraphysoderma sedebokerense]|nr:nicotinate phosphoribosyltransferase family-domain-containing protein [Paraphysoderma sedebokerense]
MASSTIPLFLLTDSYKVSHPQQYPDAEKMVAYGEFRTSYDKDPNETRIVFYGIRYIIENYIAKPWTMQDLILAETFWNTHNAGYTKFPFPKDLFLRMITENEGYFPVKIEAIPEGSVVYPHVPVYQITAEREYSKLVTYLETILTMVWYPTTVATLSRRAKTVIHEYFRDTVDEGDHWILNSRLHDFGFRGCTSVEQSIIGGCAHLLNFDGTDTMSAAYYAQMYLNNGRPIGTSIPATEHSVMTAWRTEQEAISNMISHFGSGVFACVMDSYDYANALNKVMPSIASEKVAKGGYFVVRPDSGDQVETVMMGLTALEKVFGTETNSKGYKVIKGAGVIQGDGVSYGTLQTMLKAIKEGGYSAQSVAFGMGAGLLQKLNRDTMSFATKLSYIQYADGKEKQVMKIPKTDKGKISLPGVLAVVKNEKGLPVVYPSSAAPTSPSTISLLSVVYDGTDPAKRHNKWDDFETVRNRVEKEWKMSPSVFDPISVVLKERSAQVVKMERERLEKEL